MTRAPPTPPTTFVSQGPRGKQVQIAVWRARFFRLFGFSGSKGETQIEAQGVQKSLKNEVVGLHFGSRIGPKMALLGAQWAPGPSPGGCQNAPEAPPGRKKTLPSSGGAPEKFSSESSPSQGGPGAASPFWEALGLILALLLAIGVEKAKSQILQTVSTKTLIFRVPGGSRAPFLESKSF